MCVDKKKSVRSFVENFIKIHPSVWTVALSHTHTYIHTHTHTHTLGSIATYSDKMTEYIKQELLLLVNISRVHYYHKVHV